MSHITGIILAGGASGRMGQDKAALPWGKTTLLQHLVERLYARLQPLIIAGRAQLEISTWPESVSFVNDPSPHQGPLVGFRNGLNHAPQNQCVFLTGCDFPFLQSRVVDFLQIHLLDADAVVPQSHGVLQPLLGLYQASVKKNVQQLVHQGERSLHALLNSIKVNVITNEQWQTFDPTGVMLTNINTPEEYRSAQQTYLESFGA